MLKKAISFMTAVMVMASMLINVSAAETSDAPELICLLYKMDLTGAETPADAGITTPLGTWTIETGSEGKLCLKSADAKASLMAGDSEWQNYKVIINYKMVQNEDYDLVQWKSGGSQWNFLRVSVCPRNVDNATNGKYCKYIYANPPQYSGSYLQEYYYDGSSTSVRNSSTSTDYAIDRNTMQTITTTNYNSGASIKFITSVNGGETNEYSVSSSTASKGPLAVIFEDVVKGYTFEDMGYSVEVYGIEVWGEKTPIATKAYSSNMYISDFANDADFAATGITSKAGTWEIADGTEGRKCLKGTLDSSGAASLLMGSDEWTDCDIEVSYKFVQEGSPEISDDNLMKTTVYSRSGDTLNSGNLIKYMFQNPAYYSNYFGGYVKDTSMSKQDFITKDFLSGKNESAAIQKNVMQKLHVSDINYWGTGGATIISSVEYSNGINTPSYTQSTQKWAGDGSGILSGKVGLEFKNVISNDAADPAYVEIYDIKITGTKTFNLAYLNADGTAVTELAPGAAVTVTGNMSNCTINSKNYEKPVVITAVYDSGVLCNIAMQQAEDSFNYTVNIPSDAESCTLKTFVWGSAEDMYPVFDFIDGFDAQ